MKKIILAAALAALAAVPANAVSIIGATKITVTNALNTWLQVAELQAFDFGNVNVAFSGNGGSATGTGGAYDPFATPDKAIDGNTGGDYYVDTIFHPAVEAGTQLDVTFAAPTNLQSLTIWGRRDCCSNRDLYNVSIFAGNTLLFSGQIDSRVEPGSVFFQAAPGVPEPQTWAMLIAGFGLVGASMRRRKAAVAA